MVERRLTAILNADVAGYTRLMADDEEATLRTVQHFWDLIDDIAQYHGGRVVDRVGDNLLAEFPSAVDSVEGAIEIQHRLAAENSEIEADRRLRLRIGLNIGDLIVEQDRVVGDGINIAARIQSSARPGSICLSKTVLEQVEGKIDIDVQDRGELKFKNVKKPIRVYEIDDPAFDLEPASNDTSPAAYREALTQPGRRNAITVLPFRNLSKDEDQEFFADGLAEDLLTSLASLRLNPVIARNSSFSYKNSSLDARQIGRELGARYIVGGSVRAAGQRIRVNAELVDANDARQIWSGRYDREISDIFDLQDEITLAIAGSIGPALLRSERDLAIRKMTHDLDAWECIHRSMWHLFQNSKENLAKARAWARRALKLQPMLAQGYSLIAFSHMYEIIYLWSDDPVESREKAIEAAQKAYSLDKEDPFALTALGHSHSLVNDYEKSIESLEQAIRLNPSFAIAYWALGSSLAQSGQPDAAIEMIEKAIQLSPQDSLMHEFLFNIAAAHFAAERYRESARYARKSLEMKPKQPGALRVLTAASAYLGDTATAAAAVNKLKEVAPKLNVKHLKTFLPPLLVDRYIDGLKLAGWTEQV